MTWNLGFIFIGIVVALTFLVSFAVWKMTDNKDATIAILCVGTVLAILMCWVVIGIRTSDQSQLRIDKCRTALLPKLMEQEISSPEVREILGKTCP